LAVELVSFIDYDLGFLDHEAGRLECVAKPVRGEPVAYRLKFESRSTSIVFSSTYSGSSTGQQRYFLRTKRSIFERAISLHSGRQMLATVSPSLPF
jgi:hypothetical protein